MLYVSPLKALSHDIEVNLRAPLTGIDAMLAERGEAAHGIRVGLRTGDTPAKERTRATKRPPHIFVTTPESLGILLTSAGGRRMLGTVRTVIIDEIHAVIGNKRGAHLALSLERLRELTGKPLQRIGLSATQKPIDEVARFLVGSSEDVSRCGIVDVGHARELDLGIELPQSPLEPVMANEVWAVIHDRLAGLIETHRTTIVFVSQRRLSERLARELSEHLGEDAVTTHHGSMSREMRHSAERRLKSGALRCVVATSSLELGIDVGHIDLVCQIGSPRAIAAMLQRAGRSGQFLGGTPKARVFPTSRDDLLETLALVSAIKRRVLDAVSIPEAPLDVLAQQLIAEVAGADQGVSLDALYSLACRAWPYRALPRSAFDDHDRENGESPGHSNEAHAPEDKCVVSVSSRLMMTDSNPRIRQIRVSRSQLSSDEQTNARISWGHDGALRCRHGRRAGAGRSARGFWRSTRVRSCAWRGPDAGVRMGSRRGGAEWLRVTMGVRDLDQRESGADDDLDRTERDAGYADVAWLSGPRIFGSSRL